MREVDGGERGKVQCMVREYVRGICSTLESRKGLSLGAMILKMYTIMTKK